VRKHVKPKLFSHTHLPREHTQVGSDRSWPSRPKSIKYGASNINLEHLIHLVALNRCMSLQMIKGAEITLKWAEQMITWPSMFIVIILFRCNKVHIPLLICCVVHMIY
jgi:hypothetical protein